MDNGPRQNPGYNRFDQTCSVRLTVGRLTFNQVKGVRFPYGVRVLCRFRGSGKSDLCPLGLVVERHHDTMKVAGSIPAVGTRGVANPLMNQHEVQVLGVMEGMAHLAGRNRRYGSNPWPTHGGIV